MLRTLVSKTRRNTLANGNHDSKLTLELGIPSVSLTEGLESSRTRLNMTVLMSKWLLNP